MFLGFVMNSLWGLVWFGLLIYVTVKAWQLLIKGVKGQNEGITPEVKKFSTTQTVNE